MWLTVAIEFGYEVDDASAKEIYGTADPEEMARIDERNFQDDPSCLIENIQIADKIKVSVATESALRDAWLSSPNTEDVEHAEYCMLRDCSRCQNIWRFGPRG